MVRTGAVAYERLRPVDTYAWWYARALAWSVARVLPRAALMFAFAGVVLPLVGLGKWGLAPPPSLAAAGLFALSLLGMVLLSAGDHPADQHRSWSRRMTDRGRQRPGRAARQPALRHDRAAGLLPGLRCGPGCALQPFAGLVDIPFSIYFGGLSGWSAVGAIALQFGWAAVLVAVRPRAGWARRWRRLQVQGG